MSHFQREVGGQLINLPFWPELHCNWSNKRQKWVVSNPQPLLLWPELRMPISYHNWVVSFSTFPPKSPFWVRQLKRGARWKPNPCRGLSNYAHTTWEPLSICRFRVGRCPNITKQCWFLSIWRRDLRVVTSGVVIYCKTFEKIEIMKSYLSSSAATLLGQPCLHPLYSIVVSLFTNRETAMLSTLP